MDRHISGFNAYLIFSNNLAQIGGNQIYGGWIDWHVEKDGVARYNPNISRILVFKDDIDISSDPARVCLCVSNVPNCSVTEHERDIYGQAFSLNLVAVGQRSGTVISFVEARLKVKKRDIIEGEIVNHINKRHKVQIVQRVCTSVMYTIFLNHSEETLIITPIKKESFPKFDDDQLKESADGALLFQQFLVKLVIKNCPAGFILHKTDRHCKCQSLLLIYHLKCDKDEHRI